MNKDEKHLNKDQLPVPQDRSVNVGKMLYADDPASFKKDDDENTHGGFNERLRDLDVEMEEQEKNQKLEQEEQTEVFAEEEQGYGRDRERGFDPLTHQHETSKEIASQEAEHDEEIDIDLPGKKRGRKKGKFSFLNKLRLKELAVAFKETVQQSAQSARRAVEAISTYRHFTINTPGNQAGIFDNQIETDAEHARETIIKAAAARHFLGEGLQALQQAQEAAEIAAGKAAAPYMQKMEHAKEAMDAVSSVKEAIQGAGIMGQPSAQNLGGLEHDAIHSVGMNIAGKDTSRGM